MSYGELQSTVDSERQTFLLSSLSWQFYLPPEFLVRNLLRWSCRRNIFTFSFWYLTWDLNSVLRCNKTIHYLLDYGNLLPILQCVILRKYVFNCLCLGLLPSVKLYWTELNLIFLEFFFCAVLEFEWNFVYFLHSFKQDV